jgi:hypothetical protein
MLGRLATLLVQRTTGESSQLKDVISALKSQLRK